MYVHMSAKPGIRKLSLRARTVRRGLNQNNVNVFSAYCFTEKCSHMRSDRVADSRVPYVLLEINIYDLLQSVFYRYIMI